MSRMTKWTAALAALLVGGCVAEASLHNPNVLNDPARVEAALAAGADPDARGAGGGTPLHWWASEAKGSAESGRLLLAAASNVDARDTQAGTPLLAWAYEGGPVENGRLLIEAGASVHARDTGGYTPLHWAVASARPSSDNVRLLIDAGADVNARDTDDWTPLHRAVFSERPATVNVRLLLAAGADVNARDDEGWTPLHRAVFSERPAPPVVKALIAAGADVSARTDNGRQPVDMAAEASSAEVLTALLDAGGDGADAVFDNGESLLFVTILGLPALDAGLADVPPSPRKALLLLEAGANPHRLIEREGRPTVRTVDLARRTPEFAGTRALAWMEHAEARRVEAEREGRAEPSPERIADEVADLVAAGRMPAKLEPPPGTRRACIRTGDRLSTLARDYLLNPRLFPEIMRVNGIEHGDKLRVGQCLWVPWPKPRS